MSDKTRHDIITEAIGDDSNDPRILIAVGGEKREIPHNLKNVDIIFEKDYPDIQGMFNQSSNKRSYDLICYLGANHNFDNENSLSALVEYLWNDKMSVVGGVYTDIAIYDEDTPISIQHNRAYDPKLYQNKTVLNIPFIVRSEVAPNFTKDIKNLYLWDGILDLMNKAVIFHLPQAIFKINNAMDTLELEHDINKINDTHY